MICTKCGARLLDTDQFCSKCGTRVIKEKRCPDCGAVLREGTKFCHECGRLIESTGNAHPVSEETLDIPIEAIERNILSETEAKIRAEQNGQSAVRTRTAEPSRGNRAEVRHAQTDRTGRTESDRAVKSKTAQNTGSKNKSRPSQTAPGKRTPEPPKKKRAVPEPLPKKKKPVYEEDDWEEEDWEEDDWDDEEEESVDVITIMTAVIGCVLLVVVAFLAFNLYRQYVPKNYDKVQEEEQQEEEGQDSGQEVEEAAGDSGEAVYTLTITNNVNVRDNPSTSGTNILKVAKEGETYECYGSAGDGTWYEIKLEDGTTGYVYQDYVTVE